MFTAIVPEDSFNGSRGLIQERNQSEWRGLPPCMAVHGPAYVPGCFLVLLRNEIPSLPLRSLRRATLSSLQLPGLIKGLLSSRTRPGQLSAPEGFLSWSRGFPVLAGSSRNCSWQVRPAWSALHPAGCTYDEYPLDY